MRSAEIEDHVCTYLYPLVIILKLFICCKQPSATRAFTEGLDIKVLLSIVKSILHWHSFQSKVVRGRVVRERECDLLTCVWHHTHTMKSGEETDTEIRWYKVYWIDWNSFSRAERMPLRVTEARRRITSLYIDGCKDDDCTSYCWNWLSLHISETRRPSYKLVVVVR